MEHVDTFMHTKAIVMMGFKPVCTQDDMVYLREKLQKLGFVDHCTRELALDGDFESLQMIQFLLCYSKIYPWVLKILHYLNTF